MVRLAAEQPRAVNRCMKLHTPGCRKAYAGMGPTRQSNINIDIPVGTYGETKGTNIREDQGECSLRSVLGGMFA